MGIITTAAEAKQMLLNLYEWQHGPLDIADEEVIYSLLGPGGGGSIRMNIPKLEADTFAGANFGPMPILHATADIYIDACSFMSANTVPDHLTDWATFRIMRYSGGFPAGVPVMAQRSTSTAPDGGPVVASIPYDIPFLVGDTHLLLAGEVLVFDIVKNFAGQVVGVGGWQIDYHYV